MSGTPFRAILMRTLDPGTSSPISCAMIVSRLTTAPYTVSELFTVTEVSHICSPHLSAVQPCLLSEDLGPHPCSLSLSLSVSLSLSLSLSVSLCLSLSLYISREREIWVHTCTIDLDDAVALANARARGRRRPGQQALHRAVSQLYVYWICICR